MRDNTDWTPSPDDNKLRLVDKNLINQYEAKGITAAEIFVVSIDSDIEISSQLICEIHKIAFSELYDWAGRWRTISVTVGQITPPEPARIVQLMYQFIDNLNFKISTATQPDEHLDCLVFTHYEFIRIHPFNNGNGRTGRILMNLIALKFGYGPMELYHKEGAGRKDYIEAMRAGDRGDFELLKTLIRKELVSL